MTQRVHLTVMKTYVYLKTYTEIFTEALLIIVKKCKQPKCPSTDEWINNMINNIGYNYTINNIWQ